MEWHWLERQEKGFQAIKHNLTSDAVFQYYGVDKPTTVSVHASSMDLERGPYDERATDLSL